MHSIQKPGGDSAAAAAARPARKTVRSMTGYAHRSEDTSIGRATLELRSVNSRFTDLQFRLGDDVRALEPILREQITAVVSRGKVECRMHLRSRESDSSGVQIDEAGKCTVQATEAIKVVLGIGEPLIGRLWMYDSLGMKFRTLKLRRDPSCPVCGDNPTITKYIDYEGFCAR